MVARRRLLGLVTYGVLYPGLVLIAAWVLADSPRTFNDYGILVGIVSIGGSLFMIAIRGGTRPYTHDWRESTPSDPLPAPLRSLVFVVAMAIAAFLAVIII